LQFRLHFRRPRESEDEEEEDEEGERGTHDVNAFVQASDKILSELV
jgi:hypothetical protein